MYRLTEALEFPDPAVAPKEGLLAVGGDLSPQRLLFAYQEGIFPWYSEGEPILWWSPDPRFVVRPEAVHVSRTMQKLLRKDTFQFSFDTVFGQVIRACAAAPRVGQDGTWLLPEMITAYERLHELGFAHSVEVWQQGELVGGLYGICLGKCFFGESMFMRVSNASKAGFIHLAKVLEQQGFEYIDCQAHTKHLASLGAEFIDRAEFLEVLQRNKKEPTLRGNWSEIL